MKSNWKNKYHVRILMFAVISFVMSFLSEVLIGIVIIEIRRKSIYGTFFPDHEYGVLTEALHWIQGLYSRASKSGIFLSKGMSEVVLSILILGSVILLGVILFSLFFVLFSKRLTVEMERLIDGLEEIMQGNLEVRFRIDKRDEFWLIKEKMNQMTEHVKILLENEKIAEKAKDDLITSVAHDLRTPLTSILGYIDLVRKNLELDEGVRQHYIEIAYAKAYRLEGLIQDLFNYTKLSMGEVKMNCAKLDLVKLMEQMMEEFYPSFEDSGMYSEVKVLSSPLYVMADGELMARTFANLIGNALKYGKDGKYICVLLDKEYHKISDNKQEEREEALIKIINYGQIIPSKDLQRIFERFYRAENSRSPETGGTGLGLDIARRIVELHEGTIQVASDEEHGTCFSVRIPMMQEEP